MLVVRVVAQLADALVILDNNLFAWLGAGGARNKVFIWWYHLGYFLRRFKNSFLPVFNLQFLDFTYIYKLAWDDAPPARVR